MGLDTIVLAIDEAALRTQLRAWIDAAYDQPPALVEVDSVASVPEGAQVVVMPWTSAATKAETKLLREHGVVVILDEPDPSQVRAARRAALRAGATECVDRATLDPAGLRRALEDAHDRGAAVDRIHVELRGLRERIDDAQRLRRLADALPAYISYVDTDRRYVFVNRTYSDQFNRPASELIGRTVAELLGPDNYATVGPRLDAALRGEHFRHEQRLVLPSGKVRNLDVVYVPHRRSDGAILGCFVLVIDVTERRQAEALTQRVLDNLFCQVWILDLGATVLEANRASLAMAELEPERLRGHKFWDCAWWSSSPAVQDQLRDACERAAEGQTVRHDVTVQTLGRAGKTLDLQVAPLHDADGHITHLIASAVDVTHRVDVELALRESEERSRLAQEAGKVGVWEFDPRSGETFWSSTMWAIYGDSSEAGLDPRELFEARLHPDDADRVRERAALGLGDGEQVTMVYRILRPDRSVRWIEATATRHAMPDGRPRVVGVNIDITERKQAEQVVRDSERRLRLAQEAGKLGIHDLELATGALRWDRRVRDLWGFTPDEPLDFDQAFEGVHPDDRARVLAALNRAIDPSGDGRYSVEHRIIHRVDRKVRWVSVSGRTTFEAKRPIRLLGTVLDITERKQAEAALQRSEEQLRESDRRKDEFLAMLGHELRNPLAAIRSASELLNLFTGADPRLARVRDVLERQSNHMVRLVDGLLEVSRIARGKIDLEWGRVDLRDVLAAVLEDRREQLARSGLTLTREFPPDPLWVVGDEVRLAQIFDNLLSNAIKFTVAPGQIWVTARREQAAAIIVVEDTGVGIRADMLEAIFEAFQQDSQPLARSAGGLGIGLALVRGLVELHHGQVVAHSGGLGLGARFDVELPLDPTCVPTPE